MAVRLMRVLFLEPVIVRNQPNLFSAHLPWACFTMRAALSAGGTFALAANWDVCSEWRKQGLEGTDSLCFPLDPITPVSRFGLRKTEYFKALYGSGDEPNPLTNELRAIRDVFAPDIAIMTSQNAFAR